MITQKDIDNLEEVFVTKEDFKEGMQSLKSDLINKIDDILSGVNASREEETVMSVQISDHEDRITSLEASIKTN